MTYKTKKYLRNKIRDNKKQIRINHKSRKLPQSYLTKSYIQILKLKKLKKLEVCELQSKKGLVNQSQRKYVN